MRGPAAIGLKDYSSGPDRLVIVRGTLTDPVDARRLYLFGIVPFPPENRVRFGPSEFPLLCRTGPSPTRLRDRLLAVQTDAQRGPNPLMRQLSSDIAIDVPGKYYGDSLSVNTLCYMNI
jgi:hypothetical protein